MSSWKVQFTVSALLCKTIVPGMICPQMTGAINFNGLHNQALTLSYPTLWFNLLLILLQACEERCVLDDTDTSVRAPLLLATWTPKNQEWQDC